MLIFRDRKIPIKIYGVDFREYRGKTTQELSLERLFEIEDNYAEMDDDMFELASEFFLPESYYKITYIANREELQEVVGAGRYAIYNTFGNTELAYDYKDSPALYSQNKIQIEFKFLAKRFKKI